MNNIHIAIKKTLAFFDIIDHPLTREEIFQLLWHEGWVSYKYIDVAHALDTLVKEESISLHEGMYVLSGRAHIVAERARKVTYSEDKIKIAIRASRLLRHIPFIRAIFVCNSVGFGTADDDSDIDVLMVVRHGHMWVARFLSNVLLKVLGLRTAGDHLKDKMCLSYTITDKNLNFISVREESPDVYQIYWLRHLIPVYDPDMLHASIIRANSWMSGYVSKSTSDYYPNHRTRVCDTTWSLRIRLFLTRISVASRREVWLKKIQLPRLYEFYGDVAKASDTRVVITDDMVKLHKNDRRAWYQQEWYKKSA